MCGVYVSCEYVCDVCGVCMCLVSDVCMCLVSVCGGDVACVCVVCVMSERVCVHACSTHTCTCLISL